MPNVNCAVVGCSNSKARLRKWQKELCVIHNVNHELCPCDRPFKLHCFPSKLRNGEQRQLWINAIRRQNLNGTAWSPTDTHRVCSMHFVDGAPSTDHPIPTEMLGYEKPPPAKKRRTIKRTVNDGEKKKVQEVDADHDTSCHSKDATNSTFDHSYHCKTGDVKCQDCETKNVLIKALVGKINFLVSENQKLKRQKLKPQKESTLNWRKIKDDKKMKFYTGISSIALFNTIFLLIQSYLPAMKYWKGPKRTFGAKQYRHSRNLKLKKLTQRDEFLLTLMKLRLNLLNEDLADRFGISPSLCSRTFTTWVKVISKTLGNALIAWLPVENIRENLPVGFRKAGYSKTRVIIDCTEVFIDIPKSLKLQWATWSEYKHHNTVKFLVGISPSGYITFLSDCYGGRKSDKFITKDSGFYDNLERGDIVMADRGFPIQDELLFYYCDLVIPPGARAQSQMTEEACAKTKKVANLRIHVERAINRIKCFRILKNVLPITMLQHVDDIVRACAALCNIKPKLIQHK